jgi:hypothetical protein
VKVLPGYTRLSEFPGYTRLSEFRSAVRGFRRVASAAQRSRSANNRKNLIGPDVICKTI